MHYQSPITDARYLSAPRLRRLRKSSADLCALWSGVLGLCIGLLIWHLQTFLEDPTTIRPAFLITGGLAFASAGMVAHFRRLR